MPKPGLARAIPAAIVGVLLACIIVVLIRGLQSMDPLWEPRVAMVLAPFIMSATFIWGMGGFDPRMSAHAHGPEDEHHEETALATTPAPADHAEEPVTPLALLSSQLWTVTTLIILILVVLFGFAALPTGLRLDQTTDPMASASQFATQQRFDTPLGIGSGYIIADELVIFMGFIIVALLTLFAIAGGLGFMFYFLNREVAVVKELQPTPEDLTPPAPVRVIGRVAGNLAKGLRRGVPRFFGQ
jgi:hypothetical protein